MARTKAHNKPVDVAALEQSIANPKHSQGSSLIDYKEGDNRKMLDMGKKIMFLPKVDFNKPEEVKERIMWYFNLCADYDTKPLVSGFAMALGYDRVTLYNMVKGSDERYHRYWKNLPALSKEYVSKAYDYLELSWENNFVNGKLNPVTGIFMAKNNYNYQDKVEYNMVAKPMLESTDDIISRYNAIDIDADDDK